MYLLCVGILGGKLEKVYISKLNKNGNMVEQNRNIEFILNISAHKRMQIL